MRQIVFVSSDGLVKAFTISESAEMEGASPAIFIEVGGEVIIVSGKSRILRFACLIGRLARTCDDLRSDQRSPL